MPTAHKNRPQPTKVPAAPKSTPQKDSVFFGSNFEVDSQRHLYFEQLRESFKATISDLKKQGYGEDAILDVIDFNIKLQVDVQRQAMELQKMPREDITTHTKELNARIQEIVTTVKPKVQPLAPAYDLGIKRQGEQEKFDPKAMGKPTISVSETPRNTPPPPSPSGSRSPKKPAIRL